MFHVKQPTAQAPIQNVSRETLHRLEVFAELLLTWNARINLISRADAPDVWSRHIADSLQLVPLVPPDCARAIDLGSGAGFPGLILAIATGIPFDLIESDQRKASFLREAARATSAPVAVHACRLQQSPCKPAPLITARALAPLSCLLEFATPLLAQGGVCLFPKGENAETEVQEALASWTMKVERHISSTHRSGVILRISEVARV
jgi:16S rRNA (guanine527-N7)-methyltransferase